MNALVFGTLATLPIAALLAVRMASLRPRMDPRALRVFQFKAFCFLALSALVSGSLYAFKGSLQMPIVWLVLMVISAAALLLGLLKRA